MRVILNLKTITVSRGNEYKTRDTYSSLEPGKDLNHLKTRAEVRSMLFLKKVGMLLPAVGRGVGQY